jgi:beta-glucosidase
MTDGPNGVRGTHFFNGTPSACFPCGTGLAATWDTELIQHGGVMMGEEAKAKGASILLGPTVNMQRSPLGGRGFESFSEDPILAGYMAAATVKGIQATGVIATIKHFVCNDQEHERQGANSVVTERAMREIYLLPFQIAQRDAKPKAYMTAYNKVNGTHASEKRELLQGILRDEWGFDGLVMSDWYGTYSAAEAINAGLDIEMPGPSHWRGKLVAISVGCRKISIHTLNDRVRSVLQMIERVRPLNIPEDAPEKTIDTLETASALRKVASSGIVLLKNSHNVLPLDPSKPIAIIGPNAKFCAYSGGGSANLRPYYAVTPFDGISAQATGPVHYALGATAYKKLPVLTSIVTPTPTSKQKGMEMRVYLTPPSDKSRKAVDKFVIEDSNCFFSDYKHSLITSDLFYLELEGHLTPTHDATYQFSLCVNGTAYLYLDGQELIDNATDQKPGDAFFGAGSTEVIKSTPLKAGKTYKIIVQFGTAPTSKLRKGGATQLGPGGVRIGGCVQTSPDSLITEAVALAKSCSQVIICAGLNSEWESEGYDRATMDLPPNSDALIQAVSAVNPNVVVVNQSGTPVTMPWAASIPGIIQAWYGGNETGNAIADIVFGKINPSGKLPLSWPVRVEDNPAFFNYRSDRGKVVYGEGPFIGYRFYEKTSKPVLFPFGHGLSYASFSLSNLVVSTNESSIAATLDIKNTGERDGAEVVQIYTSQRSPSVQRAPKELKGFKKITLKKGENKNIELTMQKKEACSFWDEETHSWVMEAGKYDVLVGNSSDGITLRGEFEIKEKNSWWKGL